MEENAQPREAPREPRRDRALLIGVLSLAALLGLMAYLWSDALPNGHHWTLGSFLLFMGREALLVVFFLGALLCCALAGLWRLLLRAIRR